MGLSFFYFFCFVLFSSSLVYIFVDVLSSFLSRQSVSLDKAKRTDELCDTLAGGSCPVGSTSNARASVLEQGAERQVLFIHHVASWSPGCSSCFYKNGRQAPRTCASAFATTNRRSAQEVNVQRAEALDRFRNLGALLLQAIDPPSSAVALGQRATHVDGSDRVE